MNETRAVKIVIFTVPGGFTSESVPIGVSRVIEGLDPSLGCDTTFINLETEFLGFDEIKNRIDAVKPRIIGFSAVLTHSYAYLKKLSIFLKKYFPDIAQVLGGQMSAIASIVAQRTKIDFCVTGESEPTFSELIAKLKETDFKLTDMRVFAGIKGLVFLSDGIPYFTGYAEGGKNELLQMNYELMSKFIDVEALFPKITEYRNITASVNKYELPGFFGLFFPGNVEKRKADIAASKGCVGKCTFCHRFIRGYKSFDPQSVIEHIEYLLKNRDIGLINFYGENFGSDKKAAGIIVDYLKNRRVNWSLGGARVDIIDEDVIKKWKDAGCVSISLGIESCSQKMLDVMEKRTTVEKNLNAINLCFRHGILTTMLLLIGMPGETEETIAETIGNLAKVIPDDTNMPYEICINYFQAVPGTPGYEYARSAGLIGSSLDDEERYIEGLYGVDANNIKHYLNFTDYQKEETAYWKHYIFLELIVAYIKKHGLIRTLRRKKANRYKYAAIYMLLPARVRKFILKYTIMLSTFGLSGTLATIYRKLFKPRKEFFSKVSESLRQINKRSPMPVRPDDVYTHILRLGR
ncbi:MAG: hypothetical protein CVU77_06370 [Elusimicrobia bacterium HGW-Elusimicrobia-1]|jgi:radical SAM superfamily enzyme YgiQ (UPF0313 family)|nr:MAG: hypothetical protein CVU77_06370 [Elusimicrobia bacterium HGW-Elusimicrobia-1]